MDLEVESVNYCSKTGMDLEIDLSVTYCSKCPRLSLSRITVNGITLIEPRKKILLHLLVSGSPLIFCCLL